MDGSGKIGPAADQFHYLSYLTKARIKVDVMQYIALHQSRPFRKIAEMTSGEDYHGGTSQ